MSERGVVEGRGAVGESGAVRYAALANWAIAVWREHLEEEAARAGQREREDKVERRTAS